MSGCCILLNSCSKTADKQELLPIVKIYFVTFLYLTSQELLQSRCSYKLQSFFSSVSHVLKISEFRICCSEILSQKNGAVDLVTNAILFLREVEVFIQEALQCLQRQL